MGRANRQRESTPIAASAPILLTSESAEHADPRGYFPVLVAALIGMPELRCDVFIQAEGNGRKILYRGVDSDLSLAEDQRLQERGVRHLFLRNQDRDRYEEALQKATRPQDASTMLALTLERRRDAFEAAVLGGTPTQVVEMANQVAGDVLQIINDDRFAVVEAMSLLEHDRSTFQHSCNVAVYSATLAKRLGFSDADLTLLIAGAMVHDVGKRDIPAYILRKPGLLDAREKELIRQHPTVGFRTVAPLGQLTWKQLMMVYQHHEKIDGSGYPVGAVGKEIDLWGRLCAVADVFDALTAKRPYRDQSPTAGALEIMHSEKGHFDADLLKLWTEIVS